MRAPPPVPQPDKCLLFMLEKLDSKTPLPLLLQEEAELLAPYVGPD